MHQLLNLQGFVFLDRTVHLGDLARPVFGLLVSHTCGQQLLIGRDPQQLGARANRASQLLLKNLGRAPGPLQALRGHPQTLYPAQPCGLGLPGVVSVEVGRGVGDQQVQLNKTGHGEGLLEMVRIDGTRMR